MSLPRCVVTRIGEILRIAYGDIVRHQHVNTVTRQISFLADAICEAASQSARQKLEKKRGVPA